MPRLVVVTDRRQAGGDGRALAAVVAAAVAGGARAVLLREKDLPVPERRRLADDLGRILADAGGHLIVAGDAALAAEVGAAGVHLAARDPWPSPAGDADPAGEPGTAGRPRLGGWAGLVGRSCHDLHELRAARREGAAYEAERVGRPARGERLRRRPEAQLLRCGPAASSHAVVPFGTPYPLSLYATLSPVFASASKPGYGPALGLDGLAVACAGVPDLPVLALGGVGPGRAAGCLAAGAHGVAVMGEVMRAPDPAAAVRRLLAELAARPAGAGLA